MENGGRSGGEGPVAGMRDQASEMAAGMEDQLEALRGYAEDAGEVVRAFARERPWAAIGLAAGVGFLLGRLLSRT
jgi:ElaB/YqjD/DUF883 family membrane-anchored ribosome-binding protein